MRRIDHDESQYVAAAVLTARGLIPYRDFAYLQTPLQPFLLAPVAWAAGQAAWPALRVANALLGVVAALFVHRAARQGGAGPAAALAAALLFAACDPFLYAVATARNDALPCALLAAALVPVMRATRGEASRGGAMLAGLLLAAAAAAKISYALPAAAYGVHALIDRRHRPGWIALGAAGPVLFVAWTAALAPEAFWYGVIDFPHNAPADYYRETGRAWKLAWETRLADILKYLALGPALLAMILVARHARMRRADAALDWLLIGGIVAALLPSPTWRQYLLPILPPLFVRLAILWGERPPERWVRIAMVASACAGLAPTVKGLVQRRSSGIEGVREGAVLRRAFDAAGVGDGVVTLSPQFLPATGRLPDARFAPGPFHYRSTALLDPVREAALRLISHDTLARLGAPPAILTGGEARWTGGNPQVDATLDRWARAHGYRRAAVGGRRFRLWVRQR